MNKINRFGDIGFWALLATNLYIIYYYTQHPKSIHTVVAIYWVQSVLIGFFNFLDIVTLSRIEVGSFKDKNTGKDWGKGCAGTFFLFHYGFFHVVYAVFLASSVLEIKALDWGFIKLTTLLLVASGIINFVQHKIRNQQQTANLGVLFFLPYLRIVPMHLLILIPKFLSISGALLFLVLKTVADGLMYLLGQKWVFKQGE